MTDQEKALIVRWIIENVDERVVPSDEGNSNGLIFNLVGLAMNGPGYERFNYGPHDEMVERWLAGDLPKS